MHQQIFEVKLSEIKVGSTPNLSICHFHIRLIVKSLVKKKKFKFFAKVHDEDSEKEDAVKDVKELWGMEKETQNEELSLH